MSTPTPYRPPRRRLGGRLLRVLTRLVGGVVLAAGLLLALLQVPEVQTSLARRAAAYLSQRLHYPVAVERVAIRWLDTALLEGVVLRDSSGVPMIQVPELRVDFNLRTLLRADRVVIDEVTLTRPDVRLVVARNDGRLNLNGFIAAINALTSRTDTTPRTGPPVAFEIERVHLLQAHIVYADQTRDSFPEGFNYYQMAYDSVTAEVTDFRLVADTIQMQINGLRTIEENSGLRVGEITTFFRYSDRSMDFYGLRARIGRSYLGDTLRFAYDSAADLGEFNTRVRVTANLENAVLASADLAQFAPALRNYNERLLVHGRLEGTVSRFAVRDLNLYFGSDSYLFGDVQLTGLPAFENTFIELKLSGAQVRAGDLRQYIPSDQAYDYLERFGNVYFNGNFVGFPTDFVANGSFETPLGNVRSDVNLKIGDDASASYYRGEIATEGLQIGRIVGQPDLLQRLDMAGWIEGSGLLLSNAQDSIRAEVRRFGINGYDYRNARLNAYLSRDRLRGEVTIGDPNLSLQLSGEVDLRKNAEQVELHGRIDSVNLAALGYVPRLTFVQGDVALSLAGLDPNTLLGQVAFNGLQVLYNGRMLYLDSLRVASRQDDDATRRVTVRSDLLAADFTGDFRLGEAATDLTQLARAYVTIFENDSLALAQYHRGRRGRPSSPYLVEADLRLRDVNPLMRLFLPNFYLSPNVRMEGFFQHGYTSLLGFQTRFDTLLLDENAFYGVSVDVSSSKIEDSTDVLASVQVRSRRQALTGLAESERFYFDGTWRQRTIGFETGVQQVNSTNEAQLNGALTFEDRFLTLRFDPSHFRLVDRDWQIDTRNRITLWSPDSVHVEQLAVANAGQRISADGWFSDDARDSLRVKVTAFELATLSSVIDQSLAGRLDADATLHRVAGRQPVVAGELLINDFVYEGFPLQRIYGTAAWDEPSQRLEVNLDVSRDDLKLVRVGGFVRPADDENQLSLTARFDAASLGFLQAIVPDISDVSGQISGSVRVLGTFASPFVLGSLGVTDGQFRIDYLNTRYRFSDQVYFSENEISVSNLLLRDDNENTTVLTRGSLFHDSFNNFLVSLRGNLENFQVLNTTAGTELYYGTVNASGPMEIFGPFTNLSIRGDLTTERGTRLFIPVQGDEALTTTSYISFVDADSAAYTSSNAANDTAAVGNLMLRGLTLELNLEVTPDAYGEIIFDERTGDIIRANGEGKLKMVVDTRGDFNIFGQYTITRGQYNFTLLNLINKEFVIQPGGTLIWNGDPLAATLNLNAVYQQVTSFAPLAPPSERESIPNLNRRYPVQVLLAMKNNLLAPQIALDINAPPNSYPSNLEPYVTQLRALIRYDDQELNRQVFGLLVLRSLMQPNSFGGAGFQTGAGGSLSELLSNQASYYLSQIDENLEVDIDLNGLDQDALNTLQLRLSYTALGGRLRFTRDGSFTNANNQATTSNIIGDITVEYALRPDNRLRLKMFTRNNQNLVSTLTPQYNNATTQGFSLLHTQSFNRLRDLFPRGVGEVRREEEDLPPPGSEPIAPDPDEEMPLPPVVGK